MLEFFVTGQSLRCAAPLIAAGTVNYLEAVFHFSDDWDGASKWAHFRQGETVYDLALTDDAIGADAGLDLPIGSWEVSVTGTIDETRLTTVPFILTVRESGLWDEPLHKIPMSVAEQVDQKASIALQKALAIEQAAANGDFNGTSLVPTEYYSTLDELSAAVPAPEHGTVYAVGMEGGYHLYAWDDTNEVWRDNGRIASVAGADGVDGVTFTPHVDQSGNLSWTNDGGRQNPATVNLMGARGQTGTAGADGKSPYAVAVSEGFTGTEQTFNAALASIASHAATHEYNGTDPITVSHSMLTADAVRTAAIQNGAVTQAKLAANAVSSTYSATIPTAGWENNSITLTVNGLLATDTPVVDVDMSDVDAEDVEDVQSAFAQVYRMVAGTDTLTVYALEVPETAITIRLLCVRR